MLASPALEQGRGDTARTGSVAGVIFDLDGVLVDSEIWWDEARRDWAAEHDRRWTEDDRRAVMGANGREWARTMRERLDVDVPLDRIEAEVVARVVERYRREGPPRIEGAVEAVERVAATYPTAVASSAHRDVIEAALSALGVRDRFAVVVSSDEVERGKPAPDVYLEAARRLGLPPAACLVVEDSFNGVRAAKAAGMSVVLVPNTTIPPAPGTAELADLVVPSLRELDPDARVLAGRPRTTPSTGASRTPSIAARLPGPTARRATATALDRGPRSRLRYAITRAASALLVRAVFRIRIEGADRLPDGPAILCFNHLNWADPFVLMAALPWRPRLSFFGPREEDMRVGARNRLMLWTGTAVPYKPGKNDLLEATRRVSVLLDAGERLAIAGEGRIHADERIVLPLSEGAAFFALRTRAPLVPVAINGRSWLGLGRRIRVRIGPAIDAGGRRPNREDVAAVTEALHAALLDLVSDAPEPRPPGRFGRWLSELFNEWPEGRRPERD